MGERAAADEAVVLFDGVCNMCNATVTFLIDRDPHASPHFASWQSAYGGRVLAEHGRPGFGPGSTRDPDSIVLLEHGVAYEQSTAALRIARRLGGLWSLLYAFIVVPRPVRDLVYRWVARHRYRWFGKTEQCRVPTPELRARFLDV